MENDHDPLSLLTNEQLLARVKRLAAGERDATAILLESLAELEARRAYLGEGYPSLFAYCTQALHFSEDAAYNRMKAARAARKWPVILQMIADGSVTLTSVRLLADALTDANHQQILEAARHRSKRAVEQLIASLHPQPAVPSTSDVFQRRRIRCGPRRPIAHRPRAPGSSPSTPMRQRPIGRQQGCRPAAPQVLHLWRRSATRCR